MMVLEKTVGTIRPARRRKLVWLAVILQCIPLLAAGGCINNGLSDQRGAGIGALLWVSTLFWGVGYHYLGMRLRFLIAVNVGPVAAFAGCVAASQGNTLYIYRRVDTITQADVDSADRAAVQAGLLIAGAVLLMVVDAWRLAVAHNQSLQTNPVAIQSARRIAQSGPRRRFHLRERTEARRRPPHVRRGGRGDRASTS